MPIIILEGIDGAGKSTLAEKLIDASPIPARYEHRGPMEGTVTDEYILPLLQVGQDELLITDRWHVGETIYGPIYRGKSVVAGPWNDIIEALLKDLGAVRVIMSPALSVIKQRLADRGEDYLKPEHVDAVYDSYVAYARANGYILLDHVDVATVDWLLELATGDDIVAA